MIVNLNAQVEVELTELGQKIYRDYLSQFKIPPELAYLRDPSKPIRMTLWELVHIFGPHLSIGMGIVPFVGNNIKFIGDLNA